MSAGKKSGAVPILTNPLGEIINLIPWDFVMVDGAMLDSIAKVLVREGYVLYNSQILMLLNDLQDAGYIELRHLEGSVPGHLFITKRVTIG